MNKFYAVLIFLAIGALGFCTYDKLNRFDIIVKFEELEPFDKQVPVYYKGFKVGKSTKIYPDKYYRHTFLKLKISPRNVVLPENTYAVLEKGQKTNYINLKVPGIVAVKKLKDGDTIPGESSKDISSILSEKLAEGTIDTVLDGATQLLKTSDDTMKELGDLFSQINEVVADIKGDLKSAAADLSATAEQISELSAKFNDSVKQDDVEFSFENIAETTENIKNITENIDSVSEQIDEITVPTVNSVLCNTNGTMENVNEISRGIKHTLKKRMGLIRLLFGTPVSGNECD